MKGGFSFEAPLGVDIEQAAERIGGYCGLTFQHLKKEVLHDSMTFLRPCISSR